MDPRDDAPLLKVQHQVHRPLPSTFPVPELAADSSAGGRHTRRGREAIGELPEELALPPAAHWSEDHRRLMTDSFLTSAAWAPDDGVTLRLRWPPQAHLDDPGDITECTVYWCREHASAFDPVCLDCEGPLARVPEVTPAVWRWVVRVETWLPTGTGSGSVLDTVQDVHVMTTTMDPRHVDYRRET